MIEINKRDSYVPYLRRYFNSRERKGEEGRIPPAPSHIGLQEDRVQGQRAMLRGGQVRERRRVLPAGIHQG